MQRCLVDVVFNRFLLDQLLKTNGRSVKESKGALIAAAVL